MSSNTVNTIQKITPDATHIGDSRITDDGSLINIGDLGGTDTPYISLNDEGQVNVYGQAGNPTYAGFTALAGHSESTLGVFLGDDARNTSNFHASTDGTTSIGDTDDSVNGSKVQVDDANEKVLIKADSGIAQSAPASTTASILANGQISFWIDQVGNTLKVAVKYSDGTTKTGTIALL